MGLKYELKANLLSCKLFIIYCLFVPKVNLANLDKKLYQNIPGNNNSLLNNLVSSLSPDEDGNLFVGTYDGDSNLNKKRLSAKMLTAFFV